MPSGNAAYPAVQFVGLLWFVCRCNSNAFDIESPIPLAIGHGQAAALEAFRAGAVLDRFGVGRRHRLGAARPDQQHQHHHPPFLSPPLSGFGAGPR